MKKERQTHREKLENEQQQQIVFIWPSIWTMQQKMLKINCVLVCAYNAFLLSVRLFINRWLYILGKTKMLLLKYYSIVEFGFGFAQYKSKSLHQLFNESQKRSCIVAQ